MNVMKKRSVVIGWLCSYMIVLLIPFITIFLNYAWNKKVIKNEILEANQLVLENLGNEIDRYLNREFLFRSFLLQERTFQKVISSRKKDAQFYYDVAELVKVMSSYASDMSCVVYLKGQDYVISSGGANGSAPCTMESGWPFRILCHTMTGWRYCRGSIAMTFSWGRICTTGIRKTVWSMPTVSMIICSTNRLIFLSVFRFPRWRN